MFCCKNCWSGSRQMEILITFASGQRGRPIAIFLAKSCRPSLQTVIGFTAVRGLAREGSSAVDEPNGTVFGFGSRSAIDELADGRRSGPFTTQSAGNDLGSNQFVAQLARISGCIVGVQSRYRD